MKLLIFSGAGDPQHGKYKPVYTNIINEAQRRGFDDIHLQGWCGQSSYHQEGFLSFEAALVKTKQVLAKAESANEPYSVICRSFGCATFLKAATEIRPQNIEFATLWGPPPFFTLFELFKGNVKKTIGDGLNKGVFINEALYEELYPIELLIREFDLSFKLKIAFGTKDPYCTEVFADFLNSSFANPQITYHRVSGAIHEVSEPNQEYFNALFN